MTRHEVNRDHYTCDDCGFTENYHPGDRNTANNIPILASTTGKEWTILITEFYGERTFCTPGCTVRWINANSNDANLYNRGLGRNNQGVQ